MGLNPAAWLVMASGGLQAPQITTLLSSPGTVPYACAVGAQPWWRRGPQSGVKSLAQRHTRRALPLACPVQEGVELERKALRTGEPPIAVSFRELVDRMAQELPGAPAGKQRPAGS